MDGPAHRGRFAAVAAGLFALSLALTSLGLLAVQLLTGSSWGFDLFAVLAANAVAAVLRFAVLRSWVFRPRMAGAGQPGAGQPGLSGTPGLSA
jgi:hypothetical protein